MMLLTVAFCDPNETMKFLVTYFAHFLFEQYFILSCLLPDTRSKICLYVNFFSEIKSTFYLAGTQFINFHYCMYIMFSLTKISLIYPSIFFKGLYTTPNIIQSLDLPLCIWGFKNNNKYPN